MISPRQAGSAYVLLHHVMGEAAGRKGVWAYVEGGMGAVSRSIATAAQGFGAELVTNASVRRLLHEAGRAVGVEMEDGTR
jgi:phytoene dehydrogenase-like protein